ncbi:MAG: MFS transporter [Sphingomonadaceae bacterium]|nr:MFS transporter [Sphingomonadaceae bacterium]
MTQGNATDAIGKSAMNKTFWRILPLILVAYLFAYMDRVNVSFAATQMNEDLQFSATIYGLGGGLFFLGYALFEIPSNLMLVRYGARKWIARIMITWGLLSAAMMFVQTPMQFYVLRFLLGVAEAGFYPGVIFYFAGWFPVCHRGRAVSRFYVAVPLASIVMGAMSGWLLGLDGNAGLHGWQWLFLVQGLPTVLVGLIVLRFLPDAPATVAWLTAAEKSWIADELAREQAIIGEPAKQHVIAAFRNPRVLQLGLFGFLFIGVITAINLNVPLILQAATALNDKSIGYVVALGGLLGAAAIIYGGNHADRHGDRWGNAFWCCLVLAGAVLVIGLAPSPMLVVIGYIIFATVGFTIPMLTSSGWSEVLHVRELAVGAAAINTICQIGAFVAPFGWGMAKDATGSFQPALIALSGATLVAGMLLLPLRSQVRGRSGQSAVLAA